MTTKFTKKLEARVELVFYFLFLNSFTHLFVFRFFLFVARWGMTPPTVNAYYSSIENKIGKYSVRVTVVQCLYLSAGYRMGNFAFFKKEETTVFSKTVINGLFFSFQLFPLVFFRGLSMINSSPSKSLDL